MRSDTPLIELVGNSNRSIYGRTKELSNIGIGGMVNFLDGSHPLHAALVEHDYPVGGATNSAVLVGDNEIGAAAAIAVDISNQIFDYG